MGFILPEFSFSVFWVGTDKLLDEFDRVFATLTFGDSDTTIRASFHYPTGKLAKGKRYSGGYDVVWVKGLSDNCLQIVFGEEDPAAGLNYANAVETLALPV